MLSARDCRPAKSWRRARAASELGRPSGDQRVGREGSLAGCDDQSLALVSGRRGSPVSVAPLRDTARAMSQENVEIVKAAYDAYNREDWDALAKDAAPGFEVDLSRAVGPWRGVFGLDQGLRVVAEFRETWESARWDPHEFIEAGDLVVVPSTQHDEGAWRDRGGCWCHLCMDNPQRSNRAGFHVSGEGGRTRKPGAVGARRSQLVATLSHGEGNRDWRGQIEAGAS